MILKVLRAIVRIPGIHEFVVKWLPVQFTLMEWKYIRTKDEVAECLHLFESPTQSAVDIGVLWGGYSLGLSNHFNSVIAIEANPGQIPFLESMLKRLGKRRKKDLKLIHSALSNTNQNITMRVPVNQPGNATIQSSNVLRKDQEIMEVNVTTSRLDDLDLRNIGFIKIDVEGHEIEVLEGGRETILRERPTLLVESEERHRNGAINELERFTHSVDYMLFIMKQNRFRSIDHFSLEADQSLDRKGTQGYINNFIGIPKEKVSKYSFLKPE